MFSEFQPQRSYKTVLAKNYCQLKRDVFCVDLVNMLKVQYASFVFPCSKCLFIDHCG